MTETTKSAALLSNTALSNLPNSAQEEKEFAPADESPLLITIPVNLMQPLLMAGRPPECTPEEKSAEQKLPPRPALTMGDHVYQWCSFLGVPQMYQHHGIVMAVTLIETEYIVSIADFSNWLPPPVPLQSAEIVETKHENINNSVPRRKKAWRSNCQSGSCLRTYQVTGIEIADWRVVQYEASFWSRHLSRGGTCTAARSDAPGVVRARVHFLLQLQQQQQEQEQQQEQPATDQPSLLPPYHVLQANCECVAVWCKTGTWATLQATSWLHLTAAGQLKSACTLAGAASATQVTVLAAGLWGWFGYTTHVSLLSTQPFLLPAIAAYGAVTVAAPAWWLWQAHKVWQKRTTLLNTSFWEQAMEDPTSFAENLTQWADEKVDFDNDHK